MSFFKDFKDDLSQAVDDLIPSAEREAPAPAPQPETANARRTESRIKRILCFFLISASFPAGIPGSFRESEKIK